MKIETIMDFVEAIAKQLGCPKAKVEEFFDVGETKEGMFFAALQPGKWLKEREDFKAVCDLARELGGRYVEGKRSWEIPGPGFKQPTASKDVRSEQQAPQISMPLPGGEAIPVVQQPAEKTPIPEGDEETAFLKSTAERVGHLTPILRDRSGEIIDGVHRLQADPSWQSLVVYDIDKREDPVKFHLARLIVNVCRRKVPAEEITEILGEIAKLTNWSPKRISEETGMSYQWVMKYLPNEFKRDYEAPESPRRRDLTETTQNVPSEPSGVGFEPTTSQERRTAEQPSTESVPEPRRAGAPLSESDKPEAGAPKPEPLDIADFTCSVCHRSFRITHAANNLHRLVPIKEEKT